MDYKQFMQEIYNKPAKLNQAYFAFHNYSLGNAILAMMQLNKPEPINTYKGWLTLNRQVKKGSKAISLLMPVICKTKTKDAAGEEKESSFTRFIERAYWFPLSATTGETMPEFDNLPTFSLTKALNTLEIAQTDFAKVNGNCQGYAYPQRKEIAINPLAYAPFKTAIHEIAHCLLHSDENEFFDENQLSSGEKEFEAEATAYLVCCALDKQENFESSRAYIAHWLKQDDVKEAYFKRAFGCADKILKAGRL